MASLRLRLCLRCLFVLLLAASAGGKLADMPGFYAVVDSYRLLPLSLLPAAAWALTLTELTLAAWLAAGKAMPAAAAALVGLHALYLFWLASALWRGLALPNCGCFGVYFARPLTGWRLVEDAVLLALACLLWRRCRQVRRAA
jgi:uncharacterized membrane protein YphA (DoxX/SURF4 family)